MSDYSALKATINANIKANNNHEITGAITNSVLNAMVDSLGAGYQFMGVATPTNPGSAQTPDYKCFYLATTPGTYTNLGGLVVADGEVALLKYDSSWTKEVTGIASADKLNQLGQEMAELSGQINGEPEVSIDLSDYELVNGTDDNNGNYLTGGNYGLYHRSKFVPIGEYRGRTIRIVQNAQHGQKIRMAVLQSIPDLTAASSPLVFATGYSSIIEIGSSESPYDIIVPSNAGYFYFYITDTRQTWDKTPQSVTVLATVSNFYNKSEVDEIVAGINDEIDEVGQQISDYDSVKNTLKDRIQVTGTFEYGCFYNSTSGAKYEASEWNTFSFVPEAGKQYYANGFVRPAPTALALYYDSNNSLIGIEGQGTGTNQEYTNFALTIPANCVLVRITGNGNAGVNASANYLGIYQENVPEQIERLDERIDNIDVETNHWKGKKIWWCGTSIPAGSDATIPGADETIAGNYPTQVGTDLGATVINKSVGGSMCRANVRTGNYVGANFSNITSCLSMTKEEIENFITNYATIKSVLTGNVPETLSANDIARLRAASFEDRLLPYLNGTYDMPDLFVIDHGHNDFKYKLSDNSSDIGLEPTVANIGGELAEDTYMTANNNAKLESFFGSLANIPSARKAEFIASLNRNCYIGAVNFIVTLILKYNPHARILFISNYEYENGASIAYAPLIPAQESLAASWAFPLCKVFEYLGYSNHIIPGSKAWFNATYPAQTPVTTDITAYRAYLPDGVHPHSDITGDANKIYAGIISEFIRKIY